MSAYMVQVYLYGTSMWALYLYLKCFVDVNVAITYHKVQVHLRSAAMFPGFSFEVVPMFRYCEIYQLN